MHMHDRHREPPAGTLVPGYLYHRVSYTIIGMMGCLMADRSD